MLISLNVSNRIVGLMILKKVFFIFYKILFIMRILKSHPLLKLVNSYIIDASQPSNISYAWNFEFFIINLFNYTNYNRCNFSYALQSQRIRSI